MAVRGRNSTVLLRAERARPQLIRMLPCSGRMPFGVHPLFRRQLVIAKELFAEDRGMRVSKTCGVDGRRGQHDRYARYRTLRKHRRRLGFAWGIVAAITLLGAWDMAGRMDEVAYTVSSVR